MMITINTKVSRSGPTNPLARRTAPMTLCRIDEEREVIWNAHRFSQRLDHFDRRIVAHPTSHYKDRLGQDDEDSARENVRGRHASTAVGCLTYFRMLLYCAMCGACCRFA